MVYFTFSMLMCDTSLLFKCVFCCLWFTEKAKWSIYKTREGESETDRGNREESKTLSTPGSTEWDKNKHSLTRCNLVSRTSSSSWKCLSPLSSSIPRALITAALVCLDLARPTISAPRISFPTHFLLCSSFPTC